MTPELIELQQRVDAARLDQARGQAAHEQALAARDTALRRLKEEFGIDNAEDAHAKLNELVAKAKFEAEQVDRLLREIE